MNPAAMRSAIALATCAWLACGCSLIVDTGSHEYKDDTGESAIGASGHSGSHKSDAGAMTGADAAARDGAATEPKGDAAAMHEHDAGCAGAHASSARCAPAAMSCGDLECGDRACVESSGGARCTCKDGEGWDVVRHACETCDSIPRCKSAGETGVLLIRGPDDTRCACETRDGYFYSARTASATACDADGDGFTNLEAVSAAAASDPVVRANMRCEVRRVQAIVLQSEAGDTHSIDVTDAFAAGLPLYESARDDGAKDAGTLPRYQLSDGRALAPREVNGFTKACISPGADANDDGVPDVDEWSGSALDPARYAADAELLAAVRKYVEFSHFLELHDGWYEAPTKKRATAIYRIAEKTRNPSDADHVAVRYPDGTAKYVDTCTRHIDALYSGDSPNTIGGDFSAYGDDPAMTHHSQFKCLRIVSAGSYKQAGSDETSAPERAFLKNGAIARKDSGGAEHSYDWTLNDCFADDGAESPPRAAEMINPRFAHVHCSPSAAPALDTVRWAAVSFTPYAGPYKSYFDRGGYQRGCADECLEKLDPKPIAADCMSCTTGDTGAGSVAPDAPGSDCGDGHVCDGEGACGDCVPSDTSCAPAGDITRLCDGEGPGTRRLVQRPGRSLQQRRLQHLHRADEGLQRSERRRLRGQRLGRHTRSLRGCNMACSTTHITRACAAGSCTGACNIGWDDCNTDKRTDGCEFDVSANFQHCGACGTACGDTHDRCENAGCVACGPGTLNCDHTPGCEVNSNLDQNNCGFCGNVCPAEAPTCLEGQCILIQPPCSVSHVGAGRGARLALAWMLLIAPLFLLRRARRSRPL